MNSSLTTISSFFSGRPNTPSGFNGLKRRCIFNRKIATKSSVIPNDCRAGEVLGYAGRVQAGATSRTSPLSPRADFVGYFMGQLREFYERLLRLEDNPQATSESSRHLQQELLERQSKVFQQMTQELREHNVTILDSLNSLTKDQIYSLVLDLRKKIGTFTENGETVLTDITFQDDLKGLAENRAFFNERLCALVKFQSESGEHKYGIARLPKYRFGEQKAFPRFLRVKISSRGEKLKQKQIFVPVELVLEKALAQQIAEREKGEIISFFPFSLTQSVRTTDFDKTNPIDVARGELIERGNVSQKSWVWKNYLAESGVFKLEVPSQIQQSNPEIIQLLADNLGISETNIFPVDHPVNLSQMPKFEIKEGKTKKGKTKKAKEVGIIPEEFKNPEKIFDTLKGLGDEGILFRHPSVSYKDTVLAFLEQSVKDPKVESIKLVLYRAGIGNSKKTENAIISALLKAQNNGKRVSVFLETRARGDGTENYGLIKILGKAGINVYTRVPLTERKVHAKLLLVDRNEGKTDEQTREPILTRYFHASTGNYNPVTAKFYTDMSLISANQEVGEEVATLLDHLIRGINDAPVAPEFNKILVAPFGLKEKIINLINQEADKGSNGYICMKMNELSDPEVVKALELAAQNGCKVNLIIRGVSMVLPVTHSNGGEIKILSKIDNLLEHDRLIQFGKGKDCTIYMGSADLHVRKINGKRCEVLVPVEGKKNQEYGQYRKRSTQKRRKSGQREKIKRILRQ
ncbi:MAG: hypothetical protein SFU25_05860 [Candidatus Caenarcaniphilales bacterium]|nr:hypothetical protein [Candidatus Caenarcaniphilales bacterium]